MTDTIRTFIAFKLPGTVLEALAALQADIRACGLAMKWVRAQNIHLTLKFLGDIRPADAPPVEDAIRRAAAGFRPLEVTARGVGVFPDWRRPRILWAGLQGETDTLEALQRRLDQHLNAIGFQKEKRPFKGHLTLARAKGPADAGVWGEAKARCGGFQSEPFVLDRIFLVQSQLNPAGSIYTDLAAIPLEG